MEAKIEILSIHFYISYLIDQSRSFSFSHIYACVYVCVGGGSLEGQRSIPVVWPLLPPCGFWESNSGHQPWQDVSYPLNLLTDLYCFLMWIKLYSKKNWKPKFLLKIQLLVFQLSMTIMKDFLFNVGGFSQWTDRDSVFNWKDSTV